MTVFVDGWNPTGKSTSCTVYSYNYNYAYQGSAYGAVTQAGAFDMPLYLPTTALSMWTYLSILCDLPQQGQILGVIQAY